MNHDKHTSIEHWAGLTTSRQMKFLIKRSSRYLSKTLLSLVMQSGGSKEGCTEYNGGLIVRVDIMTKFKNCSKISQKLLYSPKLAKKGQSS